MIPLHLSVTGFLSYRDPIDLDFTSFELACIAGSNGAGKSSLLDAMTWALFGQARKRDDSLINAQSAAAEVSLIFAYEGNTYRVQRVKPRDKTALLEFHILQPTAISQQPAADSYRPQGVERLLIPNSGQWKPLTEHSLRETESRIQQTLRMDYETFINASFFLQGKADQFTQQRPSDRKRILGSILGLEVWETYRQRASERRRLVEDEIANLDGRLREIAAELDEEDARKSRLAQLEADLQRLGIERSTQEAALQSIRQLAAALEEHRRSVTAQSSQLELAGRRLIEMEKRLGERRQEQETYAAVVSQAGEIEAAYAAWQEARKELERWEATASRFREHEKRREEPRLELQAARARLEQELATLQLQLAEAQEVQERIAVLQPQIASAQAETAAAEERLAAKAQLDADLQDARRRQADARAENPRLKAEMDELKERIDQLSITEGAECPLCGQPLNATDRQGLIERLTAQGKELGNRFRGNQLLLRQSDEQVAGLEERIAGLAQAEAELRSSAETLAQLKSQVEGLGVRLATWLDKGAPRLAEVENTLQEETYAPEMRQRLAKIDAELRQTGYDAAAHDQVRQAEALGRLSEASLRDLERARAALAPLEREIAELQAQIAAQGEDIARQQEQYEQAAAALDAAQTQAPDLAQAERAFYDLQEQWNRFNQEVGAARQKVDVLEDLKARRVDLEGQRETSAQQVLQYRQLERAFGKDGVPALLIEQALPEIEGKANDILARLSGGEMTVRFVTQAAYKDRSREDLRETLDIQISDGAGTRDYEMFSGGEAFRVNFAIRLALSEVLAQRAGARLQTLVVDEGFGSQDALGRQRLIEAINLVRADFAKILVITHIDELKDAFPNRIEVEKTEMGSTVRVL